MNGTLAFILGRRNGGGGGGPETDPVYTKDKPALLEKIDGKADQSALEAHKADKGIHVSGEDRERWDDEWELLSIGG